MTKNTKLFNNIGIVGIGLIGSSIARAVKKFNIANSVSLYDINESHAAQAKELEIVDHVYDNLSGLTKKSDFIILCIPPGQFVDIGPKIGPLLQKGTILTDVGSVKKTIINQIKPYLPKDVHFVPGHPVAGTENSGPAAGFAELFENRWCILTPDNDLSENEKNSVEKTRIFWEKMGSHVKFMSPEKHDLTLGITSHLPHLIAFTIVGTAVDLEEDIKSDVIKFAAGGFRDFTRIAASDPTMWRDVFLHNRESVLEILGRFTEDLTELQKAIRRGKGDDLFDKFTKTRAIRRAIIDEHQE